MDKKPEKNESGVALFMVVAAMTILSVLVTEFTYVAQVNKRLAYDGLDQLKALYLAKSGMKLSMLRLKAYQSVKGVMSSLGGGGGGANPVGAMIPKTLLEKIWSFPFIYPVPSIPGMSLIDREQLDKFTKESSLEGTYTAVIESESSRFNLNSIVETFAPMPNPSASPSPGASPIPGVSPIPGATPSTIPSFNPIAARDSLKTYLDGILQNKFQADQDFADEYRNFQMDDLIDGIAAWADRDYERRNLAGRDAVPPKKAPFYTINELHMVSGMDDGLFDLFSPGLTAATTPGVNINTMQETTLRALVPLMNDEEVKEFFKFRDSPADDNLFKAPKDFFDYLSGNVGAYRGNATEITRLQTDLQARNIFLVTDETNFKITVSAKVGQTSRVIQAWVTLSPPKSATGGTGAGGQNPSQPQLPPGSPQGIPQVPPLIDTRSGLRVTFMRIL